MTTDPAEAIIGDKSASFLELFFDLVFVLGVTQVVALIHDDPTLRGFGQGVLILVMLWWAWSQYTWITNFTGTDAVGIRLAMLASMGRWVLVSYWLLPC